MTSGGSCDVVDRRKFVFKYLTQMLFNYVSERGLHISGHFSGVIWTDLDGDGCVMTGNGDRMWLGDRKRLYQKSARLRTRGVSG